MALDQDAATHRANLDDIIKSMVNMEDAEIRAKILLYGVLGTGKSVQAASLASKLIKPKQKIVVIDTSEGWVSIRNHPTIRARNEADWKVLPFQSFEHLMSLAYAIKAKQAPFDNVGAVILDEMSKMVMFRIVEIAEKNHPATPVPEWPDWKELANESRRLLNQFFSIPGVHIIAIAHERMETTGGKNPVVIFKATPDFNMSARKVITEDMHVVARMTSTDVKDVASGTTQYVREIQVHPTHGISAKSRVGNLPVTMDLGAFTNAVVDWVNSGAAEADPLPMPNMTPITSIETSDPDTSTDAADLDVYITD